MMIDSARMDWPRLVPFAILAASVGALITAYTAELAFGIEPCILCLYQRIPYAVAGTLAVAALLAPGPRPKAWAVIGAGMAFLAGAEIAFYHVGVEQHWWRSIASCGVAAGDPEPETVEALRRLLTEARPVKACDEVDWTLFGVSMATYNVAASLALAVGSFWGAEKIRRQP
jgi:disulfide bond formation protein DsbB|tara:strand:- start:3589 stop:4104 length:516 start_codon:yes stop_codon:yes gene_type:complete